MYTPITLRQNMDGNSVTWVSNGSRAEVLDYLENPDYQNVVFIGHGTGNSFLASDGSVTPNDITSLQIPKRDGELIQHTCGGGGQGLRTALLRNPNNGYGFDSPVRLGTNYSTAWERLFN